MNSAQRWSSRTPLFPCGAPGPVVCWPCRCCHRLGPNALDGARSSRNPRLLLLLPAVGGCCVLARRRARRLGVDMTTLTPRPSPGVVAEHFVLELPHQLLICDDQPCAPTPLARPITDAVGHFLRCAQQLNSTAHRLMELPLCGPQLARLDSSQKLSPKRFTQIILLPAGCVAWRWYC